jgi:hypothetical protein
LEHSIGYCGHCVVDKVGDEMKTNKIEDSFEGSSLQRIVANLMAAHPEIILNARRNFPGCELRAFALGFCEGFRTACDMMEKGEMDIIKIKKD